MKKLILIGYMLWSGVAFAQQPAPIPFTLEERQILLSMCEAARWSARIQFDQACEALKARFAEADKLKEEKK